jgi:pimeloyl-ACP methyl ester carboxylesterase
MYALLSTSRKSLDISSMETMEQIEYLATPDKRSSLLLILMPPIGDRHDAFEKNGCIDAARTVHFDADILAVDAHQNYFTSMTISNRLHEDVVMPAKARGYRSIWMGGISLGGYGALLYAKNYKLALKRLVLIAPYIGNRGVYAEIQSSGGLSAWDPGLLIDKDERSIWTMIQGYHPASKPTLPINLMYGKQDRFVDFHRMLESRLNPACVHAINGGHEWSVWRSLWRTFVQSHSISTQTDSLP